MIDEVSRSSSGTDREIRDDWRDDGSPVTGVVDAIVALTGVQPTGLQPLYETVDPDALEELLGSASESAARRSALTVSFRHEGCDVTIAADGRLTVTRQTGDH